MSRQAPAGRDRHPRDRVLQADAVLLDEAGRTDRVAVLDDADADGIGDLPPVLEELQRLRRAAVRAQPAHVERLPQQARVEREVLVVRAQADPDDGLHFGLAHSEELYGGRGALRAGSRLARGVRLICVTPRGSDATPRRRQGGRLRTRPPADAPSLTSVKQSSRRRGWGRGNGASLAFRNAKGECSDDRDAECRGGRGAFRRVVDGHEGRRCRDGSAADPAADAAGRDRGRAGGSARRCAASATRRS